MRGIRSRHADGVWRACVLLSLSTVMAHAASARQVDRIKSNLEPLIRAAAQSEVQFAVHVPHAVSISTAGRWVRRPDRVEWRYAVQLPTAISLSFHAARLQLPSSATLTVQSAVTTITYRPADIKRADFWSRIQPGDTLEFRLDVAPAQRDDVVLDIVSWQAGYRALGAGVEDHPYFKQLRRRQPAAVSNAGCVQNYECSVSSGNSAAAQGTLGLVVGNLYQCSGTLLNDVPSDNTPYVLTARHCETGTLGGGNPGAAATVTVYWDASSPCGSTLGSIYDPGIATQTGATTIVEQQDAWLMKLANNPVVQDAQFAGFDASGAGVIGGYTIHHALGFDKQLTTWFGQAYRSQQSGTLDVKYTSNFWEVVNQTGNIGPGASGSALFNASNRLLGSLTLGRKTGDSSGYESCPATPATPNGTNGKADFTSLAAIWTSTADTTSHTVTLKAALDPKNTGTRIVAGVPAANLNFAASTYSLSTGSALTLTWDAASTSTCVATGGNGDDGWSGNVGDSGAQSVTETTGGPATYTLTCQLTGGRQVTATLTVSWAGTVPFVFLDSSSRFAWTQGPAVLTWSSNLSPCAIQGGDLSLTDLASSGSATTTETSTGDVTYTIVCGTSPSVTSTSIVSYVTPSLVLEANSTDRLIGEPLSLHWLAYAQSCTPSGGAPNDGWTNTSFGPQTVEFSPSVTATGIYVYTLSCTSGPNVEAQSVTVTVESESPYVSASVVAAQVQFTSSPDDFVSLNWISNLTDCTWGSDPVIGDDEGTQLLPHAGYFAADGALIAPQAPGIYSLTVTCASAANASNQVTSTPIIVTVSPPPPPTVTISTTLPTLTLGQQFTLTWSSGYAQNCTSMAGGDDLGIAWQANTPLSSSGSEVFTPTVAGEATLGISCQSIDPDQATVSARTTVQVTNPSNGGGDLDPFELLALAALVLGSFAKRLIRG